MLSGITIVGPEKRNKIAAALRDDVVRREDGPGEGESDGEYEDEGEEVFLEIGSWRLEVGGHG